MADPSEAHLVWTKGGTACLLTIVEDAVTLRSSISSPPGARLEARLASDPTITLKIKMHGSKLQPDGSFTLKGRVLEPTKALRTLLASLLAPLP